ncbi:TolC family protein [Cytophagaceae bacterium ABcell3]|nr:TolC family protein [Cytophagaceae bacterium ABcell3]
MKFLFSNKQLLGLAAACFMAFLSEEAIGQDEPQTEDELDILRSPMGQDLEEELIPLGDIIGIAMENSPFLTFEEAQIRSHKEQVTIAKRDFHRNLALMGNYATGNQRFIIDGAQGAGMQSNLLDGYRISLNLQIPLSDFTTRKQQIRVSQAELDAARSRMGQAEIELKRQVVEEYNALLSAQKVLRIVSTNKENSSIMQEMAERQFRDGVITVEELARVNEIATNAEINFEEMKRNFNTLYMQFENLVGVPITTLMRER